MSGFGFGPPDEFVIGDLGLSLVEAEPTTARLVRLRGSRIADRVASFRPARLAQRVLTFAPTRLSGRVIYLEE